MTMLKAARFNIRREAASPAPVPVSRPVRRPAPAMPQNGDMLFDNPEDGFGDQVFETAGGPDRDGGAAAAEAGQAANVFAAGGDDLAAIRQEGLTGRQLRTARRLAQSHNLPATSDYDAVRLLRAAGINPFQRGSMLDLIPGVAGDSGALPGEDARAGQAAPAQGAGARSADSPAAKSQPAQGQAAARAASAPAPGAGNGGAGAPPSGGTGRALTPLPGDGVRLPQTMKPIQLPSTEHRVEVNHAAEILRMQEDIAKRRRRKLALLFVRMFVFVLLPTLVAGWYFSSVATRQYGTKSEFSVQTADNPLATGGMGGMFAETPMATAKDSISVQGYLQSREAMLRLEEDIGFSAAFSEARIDPLLRLPPNASREEAYKLYKSHILISYDSSEGIIRMEVIAPDPSLSVDWSKQLISYAEEQVDQLTQRLRADAMQGSDEIYLEAEAAVLDAQTRVLTLQEQFKVLSSESELALLTTQIGTLETQLIQERLALAQMEANSNPNAARLEPVRRRISTLENEIALLRSRLTEGAEGGTSLAQIQSQLLVAQADVETRQLMLAQSLQAKENSRIEANRKTRYLSTSVAPVPPDVPTYPRVFENTLVTLLILTGIYLMISMTVAILREQVSS